MLRRIVYFCPDPGKPSAGVAVLLKQAMLLARRAMTPASSTLRAPPLEKVVSVARIFYLRNPHLRHYRFERLHGLPRKGFAEKLASSRIVLHTDEIAGMPTLPLEAMACHTVPVGWRSFGGSEFMDENNGFWVDNGDVIALAKRLSEVVNLHEQGALDMVRLVSGFEQTLHEFTPEHEQRNTLAYFQGLLAD